MVKKGIIAIVVVSIVWVVLDMIHHQGILSGFYEETADLWRPLGEQKRGVMTVVTLISVFVFVTIYAGFFGKKSLLRGAGYGLLFGFGAGVSMGHGSYSVMPIPYPLALGWFLGSVVKGLVAGVLVGLIVRE